MAANLNKSSILRAAWAYARSWRHHDASFKFNEQFNCWGQPRNGATIRSFDDIFATTPIRLAEAMRRAWAEAKESAEVLAARAELMAAQAIELTSAAWPAIQAAEARLAHLLAA